MPEISKKYIPKHKGDANPNPKLLKFVTKVTDRIPAKMKGVTTEDPEYWGLACIFEDEMDAKTREASLDLLLDVVSQKAMAPSGIFVSASFRSLTVQPILSPTIFSAPITVSIEKQEAAW